MQWRAHDHGSAIVQLKSAGDYADSRFRFQMPEKDRWLYCTRNERTVESYYLTFAAKFKISRASHNSLLKSAESKLKLQNPRLTVYQWRILDKGSMVFDLRGLGMPQDVFERLLEAVRVSADLTLIHDTALVRMQVLDRVLDRHDVLVPLLVDLVDHRGERGRLAGAGRPRDENEATRLLR